MNTQIILLLLLTTIGVMLCIIAAMLFRAKRREDAMLNVKMSRIFRLMNRISSLRTAIYRHEAQRNVSQINS